MKTGKISESIFKRSVLKLVKAKRAENVHCAAVGTEYAEMEMATGARYLTVAATETVAMDIESRAATGIYMAANHVAATGAEPVSIMMELLFPEETEESVLKQQVRQMNDVCEQLQIAVAGCKAQVTGAVNRPAASVTAFGKKYTTTEQKSLQNESGKGQIIKRDSTRKATSGMDILVTKWAGLAGTVLLANERREELSTKFAQPFIDGACRLENAQSVMREAAIAKEHGAAAMLDASWGGIFAALWEFAQANQIGMEIDLKAIPLKQETVEICEFFGMNPYELLSTGAMVLAAEDGNALKMELEKAGIPAAIVGKATASNDRILLNDGETRFLEPAKPDSIFQVFAG